MATYYFWYDPTTGQLWPASQVQANVPVPPGWGIPLDAQALAWDTDANPSAEDVWWNPQYYRVQNGQIVAVPYWTVTQSTSSGTTTLTATLNNPPSSPPTSGTATIGQTTIDLAITNNTMTLPVQLHNSLTGYSVPVTFSASGTVAASITVGSGPQPTCGIQAVAPTTSENPYVIGPVGQGSLAFLRQQALGVQSVEELLAALLEGEQNLAVLLSSFWHLFLDKILPMLQASTYTPLSLTSAEQATITLLQNQLQPNLLPLSSLQNNGTPIPPLADALAQAVAVQQSLAKYAQWVGELPGLA
ncbi:MAG: hypothetical protein K6U87_10305 [Firmicutes bacterium]|nr:hypothetical protein [Bacillota bacterium]